MWRWRRTFHFPAKSSLFLLTAGAGCTVTAIAISDESPVTFSHFNKFSAGFHGLVRSSRAVFTIASNVIDYKYSLHGLPETSDEYKRILSEVHLRSANKILKLCEANRGFYVKAGQFAAALRQLPAEYSSTLSSLQDQAVPCEFREIKEVIIRSLKKELTDMFLSFDEQPIAAASIAQVHHAVLKNHEEVAVKVQYPGLDQLVKIDITTMSFLSNFVTWVFPEYRFGWIVSEFKEAITMELDFVQEAKNSERTANNFRSNKQVKVPKIFWELTSGQVLTMQFCSGHKVDDLDSLKQAGIDPKEVARTLVEVFASMIFIHGFVHRDLHPGNVLVAPRGPKGFHIVLLDHGTYKELDEEFRLDYCRLWEALILLDSNKVQELGERFGIGKYTKFLPLIFIGRMINSKSAPGKEMSIQEKKEVKEDLRSLKMEDISSFMESLPPDFLTILRTDGLLRSNLNKLGAPRHYRLLTYVKCAIYGLSSRSKSKNNSVLAVDSLFPGLKSRLRYLRVRCLLGFLELFALVEDLKYFLTEHYKQSKFSRLSMSSSSYTSTNSHPRACFCGLQAKECTAYTDRNYGRRFYGCPHYGSLNKCNYFEWRDAQYNARAVYVINNLVNEKEKLKEDNRVLLDSIREQQSELASMKILLDRLMVEKEVIKVDSEAIIGKLQNCDRSPIKTLVVCMFVFMCLNVVVVKWAM